MTPVISEDTETDLEFYRCTYCHALTSYWWAFCSQCEWKWDRDEDERQQ